MRCCRSIQQDIRRGLTSPVTGIDGDFTALASIGITTTATGTLELDAAKLNKALSADPDAVAQLFGSENGVAARLYAQVDARLASDSDLDSRNTTLKRQLDDDQSRQGSAGAAHGADRSTLSQAVHGAGLAAFAAADDVELPDAAAGERAESRIVSRAKARPT